MSQPLNIRNVDDNTITRLTEQAAAEGVSLSEWVRQCLDQAAALMSPAEFAAKPHALTAKTMSSEEFAAYYDARLHKRRYTPQPKAG